MEAEANTTLSKVFINRNFNQKCIANWKLELLELMSRELEAKCNKKKIRKAEPGGELCKRRTNE